VYEVGVVPLPGGVTVTTTEAFPGTAVGAPGAFGAVIGVVDEDAAEGDDVPSGLVAVAVNV
jgi:hypothetical protein